jgi:hypothetical protein
MNDIEVRLLRKLIGDDAVKYMIANEMEYEKLYDEYIKVNGKPYIIGIDLSISEDRTGYSPH